MRWATLGVRAVSHLSPNFDLPRTSRASFIFTLQHTILYLFGILTCFYYRLVASSDRGARLAKGTHGIFGIHNVNFGGHPEEWL
jgi:hypothetical protein